MKLFWTIVIVILLSIAKTWALLAQGIFILGDTGQAERMSAMAKQLIEAKKQLDEVRRLVRVTNTIVQIAGDPKSVIASMADLSSVSRQLDQIFRTPTTREFRNLVRASDSLGRSNEYFKREVGNSYLSGKKQVPRKANLYRVYSLAEASYDSFENLINTDRLIQQKEAKRQEKLIDDLVNAKTQVEIDKINVAIAASKSAQDVSSHQVMKQKMEMDMQKMAIETERNKIMSAQNEERFHELHEAEKRLNAREKAYEEQFKNKMIVTIAEPSECDLI